MVTKIKNQEIEIVSLNEGYANLTEYLPKLGEIIAFNKVDFSRLPTIKVPTGGNTSFNVTDLDGEHAEPEVLGVVVNWQEYRVFWEKALDDPEGGSGQSPDCYSTDTVGEPGLRL